MAGAMKKKAKGAAKKKTMPKVTAPRRLTDLQKRFVDILQSMKSPCKVKAYLWAGYTPCKTSKGNIANSQKTLRKPHVKAYYESLRDAATTTARKTKEDILQEMEYLAFSDITEILTWNGCSITLKPSSQLTKPQRAAIATVYRSRKGKIKVVLYDKKGSLETLGKQYGLFPNTTKVAGDEGKPIEVHHKLSIEEMKERLRDLDNAGPGLATN